MSDKPLHTFTSHIAGKNAKVSIYADRIEWAKDGMSAGKVAAGLFTVGASLLATGVNTRKGTEMIPVRSISSVTTKRDGMMNTKVSVITTGNTIDFRVGHGEAKEISGILLKLISGGHPAQQAPSAPVAEAKPDAMAQLQQLGSLRDAGVLSDAEFARKKAELLGRI